jgi:tetratricopeptide (TPR) repeat protein
VQTPFENAFFVKVTQLRLERNYAEAIRLLQTRLAQLKFTSEIYKGATQVYLAIAQRLAGDAAGAKAAAEQARNTLEPLSKKQPDNSNFAEWLALAYALLGNKELALKEAERATMLLPSAKDGVDGPGAEENLALIQAIFGQNDRAISTLSRLLQTPFQSQLYGPMPLTPAFSQTRSALETACAPIPLSSSSASKSLSARRRKVAESFQVLLSFNCLLRPVVRRKEHSGDRFPRFPLVGWLGQV